MNDLRGNAKVGVVRNHIWKGRHLDSARVLPNIEPSLDAECSEFVFLWWPGEEYGAIVGGQSLEFLQRFYGSIVIATTWGEFMGAIGDRGRAFVKLFTQCNERQIGDDERMEDLRDEDWILYDTAFPITQVVEEAFSRFGRQFPEAEGFLEMTTEYGVRYRLYPKSHFVEMKEHFELQGLHLGAMRSPFPKGLHDHGPAR